MKAIEFYTTPEGEVTMRPIGEAERQLKETDTDFIQAFLAILREFYPEAYDALMDIYSKNSNNKRYRDFIAVRRFIKCNFGLYDNMIDVDENWNFNFEFVGCPLRGECKHDKVICAPKFNSKLSDRQIEVMRMLYDGKNDSEIAEKLFISLNTVNNHRKNSFRKVGVHSLLYHRIINRVKGIGRYHAIRFSLLHKCVCRTHKPTINQRMALFEKGNKIGNRFSSDNQPQNSGRKPSVYKYIKDITGKKVAPEMSKEDYYKVIRFLMESTPETLEGLVKNKDGTPNKKTPVWVLNVVSAINADIRYGRTYTVDSLFDRVFGKPTQQIESEVNAQVTNNSMDLSALTTDELLQYNSLLEKIKAGNGTK